MLYINYTSIKKKSAVTLHVPDYNSCVLLQNKPPQKPVDSISNSRTPLAVQRLRHCTPTAGAHGFYPRLGN